MILFEKSELTVIRRSVHQALGLGDRLQIRERRRHDLAVAQRQVNDLVVGAHVAHRNGQDRLRRDA